MLIGSIKFIGFKKGKSFDYFGGVISFRFPIGNDSKGNGKMGIELR
jgi:hypothetical protein